MQCLPLLVRLDHQRANKKATTHEKNGKWHYFLRFGSKQATTPAILIPGVIIP
jgi:hypothetical protein